MSGFDIEAEVARLESEGKLKAAKSLRRNLRAPRSATVKVTCWNRKCHATAEVSREEAPGWKCDEHK